LCAPSAPLPSLLCGVVEVLLTTTAAAEVAVAAADAATAEPLTPGDVVGGVRSGSKRVGGCSPGSVTRDGCS
jgi:hypothetical protein